MPQRAHSVVGRPRKKKLKLIKVSTFLVPFIKAVSSNSLGRKKTSFHRTCPGRTMQTNANIQFCLNSGKNSYFMTNSIKNIRLPYSFILGVADSFQGISMPLPDR